MATTLQNALKKRTQQLMQISHINYDDWLEEKHNEFINQHSSIIDELIAKELRKTNQANQHHEN